MLKRLNRLPPTRIPIDRFEAAESVQNIFDYDISFKSTWTQFAGHVLLGFVIYRGLDTT